MKALSADAYQQELTARERFHTGLFVFFFLVARLLKHVPEYFTIDTRYVILIMLCVCWAEGVRNRVLSKRFAGLLSLMAYNLALLFFLQIIRYDIMRTQVLFGRYLWYLYYVPIIGTGLCSFLAALSECVREKTFRMAGAAVTGLMFLLILLVLTNDLHQRVFSFTVPLGLASGDPGKYAHGALFYALSACYLLLTLVSFCLLLARSLRTNQGTHPRKAYLVSICAVILYLIYTVYYVRFGTSPLIFGAGLHFQEMLMIAVLAFWEPVLRADYVFWRKDVAAGERMEVAAISGEEMRVEEEAARYAAQSALYDKITRAVAPFLARIEALTGESEKRGGEEKDKGRMAHTALEGVFVKRTANLMLLSEEAKQTQGRLNVGELALSVKETLDTYALGGADTAFSDGTARMETDADAKTLTKTYERFCKRLEALYESGADIHVLLLPDAENVFRLQVNGEDV